ncbi:kelch domain-containing protein 7A [Corythoichthys intestinalis]|uniref:kelch domain-containing protein 7A n=1 Tax=Corythoichthys intestinalis TaxID=161448 RepID=UPI0025A55D75|nr:kelch domain-containing protein 7A [Corythoichthys intestinalis]XP_061814236.1 kelch domain-containing protein 7A-like [Nerophis lumbriciformis]
MAIAELLGVEFDMQLLLKMSLSVATVLLVSLVYRFYSSRSTEEIQVNHCQEPQTCKRCKTQLTDGTNDDLLGPSSSEDDKQNTTEDNPVQDASNLSNCDQHFSKEANVPSTSGRELNPPNPAKSGLSSTKGRRSTSFLKKVEGGMGVGRELRQELEQRGVYSSFISKSEIKVEDAKLVLDHPSDQVVYGKIYEYYVESSSHCSTNPNNIVGQNETDSEPRQTEIGSHSSILMESPSSVDFDITEESSLLGNPMSTSTPLRKHSYLAAAEQSALPSPVSTSCSSTSAGPLISSSINNKHQNGSKCPDLEAVLLNRFVHRSDVENLKSQVDLGNCLEALFLAKKYDERSVVQAAVEVMSDNYLQVLLDRDLYGRLTGAERELIRRQRTSGRRFIVVADMNPQDSSSDSRAVKKKPSALYYYDDFQDTWDKLCSIPPEVISNACGMCTMDNYLFVAVGMDSEATPSKRVFCYNPLTDIWKEISSMNEARPRCKLAALDGYIYAIGGECLTSVERYDPHSDKWTFVAPLPNDTFAVAHHVTVCNRELFVSGGTIRYMLLRYSPKSDTWRGSLLAGNKDRTADLVAVGPFLYRFEVNPLLGISVYRYHTVARLWYQCDTKRLPNCAAFQCVAMDDNIYCVSRHFTLRFEADEISPAFAKEHLSISVTNGLLFPFVLSLPDKKPLQTSV